MINIEKIVLQYINSLPEGDKFDLGDLGSYNKEELLEIFLNNSNSDVKNYLIKYIQDEIIKNLSPKIDNISNTLI